jgi:hypothetical protein
MPAQSANALLLVVCRAPVGVGGHDDAGLLAIGLGNFAEDLALGIGGLMRRVA